MKPLYNTSIKIFISPLSILYLQKVLSKHLKKCVFYMIYKFKLSLRFSFNSKYIDYYYNYYRETPNLSRGLNKGYSRKSGLMRLQYRGCGLN